MSDHATTDAQDVGDIFKQTVSSVSDTVVELKHENAVDIELKFRSLTTSKNGWLIFSTSSTEAGIELNLATRVLPQSRPVFKPAAPAVNFGEVDKKTTAVQKFVIANTGTEDLNVRQLSITNSNPSKCRFSFPVPVILPFSIPAGNQAEIQIACTVDAKDSEQNTGVLLVSHSALPTPVQIPLVANQDN